MTDAPGYLLGFLLTGAFRALVDEAHLELSTQGHPGLRPAHGFAMQAIGNGATAVELGRRLGISKQAAGKTIEGLDELGYITRTVDPTDSRRRIVTASPRGLEMLRLSAETFATITSRWRLEVGSGTYDAMVTGLQQIGHSHGRVDFSSWLS